MELQKKKENILFFS